MKEPFIRRPKVIAALTGLALVIGLAVIPAQASNTQQYAKPYSTGTIGKGAAPGGPVTREQIIARAKDWVDQRVGYSQGSGWEDAATSGPYRRDCSGFVSMAWQLRTSLSTRTLSTVARELSELEELEPGDALVNTTHHAVLFGGWTNKAKGDFFYYSESNTSVPAHKTNANIHHRPSPAGPATPTSPSATSTSPLPRNPPAWDRFQSISTDHFESSARRKKQPHQDQPTSDHSPCALHERVCSRQSRRGGVVQRVRSLRSRFQAARAASRAGSPWRRSRRGLTEPRNAALGSGHGN
ncbi:hypothetical protein ACWGDE_03950 [Streptomyces sp. NPDC054956]